MTYLKTIDVERATGEVARYYEKDIAEDGYVTESTRSFTTREPILGVVDAFMRGLKAGATLSPREWKLGTLIAAQGVGSTYCGLMFGRALLRDLGSPEAVEKVATDFRTAGLPAKEVAMLEYIEKICLAPTTISQRDIDGLRGQGWRDEQIFDMALCATFRQFLSRFFLAVGANADQPVVDAIPTPALREALSFGKVAK